MYFIALLELKFFSIWASPDENITELMQMLHFWVQFTLKIPLMLYCGFNFVKKYRWCHIVDQFLQKNCIDVTLLVKILPEKNCIVIVVLLRTHIAMLWPSVWYGHSMAIWVLSHTTITIQFFPGNILTNNVTSTIFLAKNWTTTWHQHYFLTKFTPQYNINDILSPNWTQKSNIYTNSVG